MTAIALVRGHHLSKEESVSYEPIRDQFTFTCVSTTFPWYDHTEIAFPIRYVPAVESLLGLLSGGLARKMFGKLDAVNGIGQYMPGLKSALWAQDLVHCSDACHWFTYQAARLKRELKYKLVVVHYENIPFARENKPLVRLTRPRVYEQADAFFAMSSRAREALLREGVPDDKIAVIGNAVDTYRFKPDSQARVQWRESLRLPAECLMVLFVGRLHESKGVFHLVDAAHRILSREPVRSRLHFVLAGRGGAETALRKRIRRLGIEDHVSILGSVPHAEIHGLFASADIFVLPSIPTRYWQEQFGIVLIESQACGVPVVSTHSGSIPEVVGNAGLLVQPADHLALSEGILSLAEDTRRREALATASRQRAVTHFSLPVVGKKLLAAYSAVLRGAPAPTDLKTL
jgi:glycosyltransferase involved in cell wall biosynthesis